MEYLINNEAEKAIRHFQGAAKVALQSTCHRSRCGSVIIKKGELIGSGFNSPPLQKEEQRKCSNSKDLYHLKVTDKTCCVHAEQRAIIDALKNNSVKLAGSQLYFIRLDEQGTITKAGQPYCTICSKLALEVGIKEFVLWHDQGICSYGTEEYNLLSFKFGG